MKKKLKVLSLFDGMSCGQIALQKMGYSHEQGNLDYYASEIDKHAIKVTQHNFPNTIQLGDVTKWESWDINFADIDLILAGSPCQGFSFAGKQLNFDDPRSRLFFVFNDILKHIKSINPQVKYLLENVVMQKKFSDIINQCLGVSPVFINSLNFTHQSRKRLYWSNVEFSAEHNTCKFEIPNIDYNIGRMVGKRLLDGVRKDNDKSIPIEQYIEVSNNKYYNCITTVAKDNIITSKPTGRYKLRDIDRNDFRYLTPEECEAAQTVPIGYTKIVSASNRLKLIGNGWTVDVIVHILKQLI